MSEIIMLSNVRLSFPQLIDPVERINPKTQVKTLVWSTELILPENHQGWADFQQRYAQLAQEYWKELRPQIMQAVQNDKKSRCFGDGSEKVNSKTFVQYAGYNGMKYISASSKKVPPQMIEANGKAIDAANTMAYQAMARKLYGGCYVNAAIKPWVQKPGVDYGHGFRCDLIALQFAKDGEPFGDSVPDASSLFGAVAAPAGGATPAGMAFPAFMS